MGNTTLRVDAQSRDIVIENGDIALLHDNETIAQAVRATLSVYKGEWFLDTRHGADYERLIELPSGSREANDILREAVYQETGVKHIESLSVAHDGRRIQVRLSARLADGSPIGVEV